MTGGAEGVLLQYGALGVMALGASYAVVKLYKRLEEQADRERQRADRAEEQLAALNVLIRDQLVVALTRATDVIGRVVELLSDQRREEDRRTRSS